MDIKEKVNKLPDLPGVYLMKDRFGKIIYIGKAVSIRKRVKSYFSKSRPYSLKIDALLEELYDIDCIVTSSQAQALIFESSLIKRFKPKFNIALRDDKRYPMLRLTINERYPRLLIARKRLDDGALYYGPYTQAALLKEAVSVIRQTFPLRTCKAIGSRPCLNYHLGRCLGPHKGSFIKDIDAMYRKNVNNLKLFLEGKKDELIKKLTKDMLLESKRQNFEEAARARDQIQALTSITTAPYVSKSEFRHELMALKNILGLESIPNRIEAYDISNIHGKEAVGSLVTFIEGRPNKSFYKRFRIKQLTQIDDYAMMQEVLRRRFVRLKKEREPMPDLIIIDGGKGHLVAAKNILIKLGFIHTAVISIAKKFEEIFYSYQKEPLRLSNKDRVLKLIQRIRDEAHRFALLYHRKLRKKIITTSVLDGIKGIGAKRKKILLRHFESIDAIKKASLDELTKLKGLNRNIALRIKGHL